MLQCPDGNAHIAGLRRQRGERAQRPWGAAWSAAPGRHAALLILQGALLFAVGCSAAHVSRAPRPRQGLRGPLTGPAPRWCGSGVMKTAYQHSADAGPSTKAGKHGAVDVPQPPSAEQSSFHLVCGVPARPSACSQGAWPKATTAFCGASANGERPH